MIGFVIGTLCLVGLVKTVCRGRGWSGGGCHGGACHGGGRHGGGGRFGGRGWGGGFGRRSAARFLFEILDATPGQEKVILGAMDDVRAAGDEAKKQWRAARAETAGALRGDVLDEGALAGASTRLEAAGQTLRDAMTAALARVHEALEPDQRRRLAELVDDGPAFFDRFGGGPYRRGLLRLATDFFPPENAMNVKRKLLVGLLALGTLAGFGFEAARFHHRHGRQAEWDHHADCGDDAKRAPPR